MAGGAIAAFTSQACTYRPVTSGMWVFARLRVFVI